MREWLLVTNISLILGCIVSNVCLESIWKRTGDSSVFSIQKISEREREIEREGGESVREKGRDRERQIDERAESSV